MAMHHPFTAPMEEDEELLETQPERVRAQAYDIILNGCELGGGSIRIHSTQLQSAMFRALGFTDEQARERFGHLFTAFQYGAPPHGGLRPGPAVHAPVRARFHPRCYRLPQGAERVGADDPLPRPGGSKAAG